MSDRMCQNSAWKISWSENKRCKSICFSFMFWGRIILCLLQILSLSQLPTLIKCWQPPVSVLLILPASEDNQQSALPSLCWIHSSQSGVNIFLQYTQTQQQFPNSFAETLNTLQTWPTGFQTEHLNNVFRACVIHTWITTGGTYHLIKIFCITSWSQSNFSVYDS